MLLCSFFWFLVELSKISKQRFWDRNIAGKRRSNLVIIIPSEHSGSVIVLNLAFDTVELVEDGLTYRAVLSYSQVKRWPCICACVDYIFDGSGLYHISFFLVSRMHRRTLQSQYFLSDAVGLSSWSFGLFTLPCQTDPYCVLLRPQVAATLLVPCPFFSRCVLRKKGSSWYIVFTCVYAVARDQSILVCQPVLLVQLSFCRLFSLNRGPWIAVRKGL